MSYQTAPIPRKKPTIPIWVWIVSGVVLFLCCGGGLIALAASSTDPNASESDPPAIQVLDTTDPTDTGIPAAEEPSEEPVVEQPAAPAPPQSVTSTGSGMAVGQLNATLNGSFQVDYSASSWCMMIDFLKADGSSGVGNPFDNLNVCGDDIYGQLQGSMIVNLTDVTMIQVDNTTGPWTVTFTALG